MTNKVNKIYTFEREIRDAQSKLKNHKLYTKKWYELNDYIRSLYMLIILQTAVGKSTA